MRCFICDSTLSEETIHWNHDHGDWEPCPECLLAIAEVFEDPLDEEEISRILEMEDEEGFYEMDDDFP